MNKVDYKYIDNIRLIAPYKNLPLCCLNIDKLISTHIFYKNSLSDWLLLEQLKGQIRVVRIKAYETTNLLQHHSFHQSSEPTFLTSWNYCVLPPALSLILLHQLISLVNIKYNFMFMHIVQQALHYLTLKVILAYF